MIFRHVSLCAISWLLLACGGGPATPVQPTPARQPADLDAAAFVGAFRAGVEQLFSEHPAEAAAALERASRLNPADDVTLYLLAKARLSAGDAVGALASLERLERGGSDLVPNAKAFAKIGDDARFRAIVASIRARAVAETQQVVEAFRVDEAGLIPEGIAADATAHVFYVGSVRKRKILRVRGGHAEDFVTASRGMHGVLGLRVDAAHGLLWAATAAAEEEDGYRAADEGQSELFAFDAATGATKTRLAAPGGGKHLFNDVAVAADGAAFVTDSEAGGVWVVRAGATSLQPLVAAGTFIYPNGIAFDAASGALFVADLTAVWRVDASAGTVALVPFSAGAATSGLDGLYVTGDWLVGVQNIAGAGRVIAYHIDVARTRLDGRRILAAFHPAFDVPTTAAIDGSALYLVANSQVGSDKPPAPLVVLRLTL